MKAWISRGIALAVTAGLAVWFHYLMLPALTLKSEGFWSYLILIVVIACGLFVGADLSTLGKSKILSMKRRFFSTKIVGVVAVVLLLGWLLASIPSWEVFRAGTYRNSITISNDGDFDQDVPRVQDAKDIPIVDMLTAQQLGDRTMGAMEHYLSQYEVDGEYNLISYKGSYYRISPMNYGGFFKYMNSKKTGIPGYVLVNIYTQEAELVELKQPIQYSPSAHFKHLLSRHLRKNYPTYVFDKAQFEIDDDGIPYYIVPVTSPTAGLFGARVVKRVVLVNAVTGETADVAVADVPAWVDHVFSVDYIMERINWHYSYVHGFWNTAFANKDVRKTSYSFDAEQYYFIAKEDDVYLYTGITSAGKDESNIGFVMANMRTGDIKYYSNPGAEESSAQASAEGVVQQFGYTAGPAMLVNIDGMETYFMSLKDNQMLVKKVALVNKTNYTIAVVEDTVAQAVAAYRARFSGEIKTETTEISGTVSELYTAIKEGNTHYYFRLDGEPRLFASSLLNNDRQVAMKVGDKVKIQVVATGENTAIVQTITIE